MGNCFLHGQTNLGGVKSGKALVANAITAKGVITASDASFETMADNISQISSSAEIKSYTINSSSYLYENYYINLATITLDKPLLAILGVRGINNNGVSYFNCFSWINFATNTVALSSSNTYSKYSCKDSAFSASTYYLIAPAVYDKIANDDNYTSSYNFIDTNNAAKIYVKISSDRKTLYIYGSTSSSFAYYDQKISSGKNILYYITE